MEVPDQLRSDAARSEPSAWDAWVSAHPGVAADAAHQLQPLLADAGAEKSAALAPDGQVLDAFLWALRLVQLAMEVPGAAAVLYKPGADQSAERSCAALASMELQQQAEPQGAG